MVVIWQASGRYEEASEVYKATIDTVSNSEEKQFIALQALECYLGMWHVLSRDQSLTI